MPRWQYTMKGIDPTTGQEVEVGVNPDHNGVIILNKVYDPNILDWVNMEQPQINVSNMDLTLSMGDVEALLADNYWKRMKPYTYASGKPKYICRNTDIDANETDVDWYVWKYSDADIPVIEGPRIGAVNTELVVDAFPWNT